MKINTLAIITTTLLLISTLFINLGNADNQITYTIQSNGKISNENPLTTKTEFLIRYVWIGSITTIEGVQEYVAEHPWGTGILFTDLSSGILSIISYTGWDENKTWQGDYGGIKYSQLKAVIDEFHRLGWKVIYSPGNTPTSGDKYLYNYLTQQHPELIARAGDNRTYNQVQNNKIMVNFFANYTSPDSERNIMTGQRLSDLYSQRLSQMINDEAFLWDGWFGVDGWNGFTNQGMYWVWSTYEPYGRRVGTSDLSKWYYGDDQSITEWSKSDHTIDLPQEWNNYNSTQKINWIINNANLQWWEYWQTRFAQFYAQINQIFIDRPNELKVGNIISQDLSSTWADNGINNPAGMENLTKFAEHGSFDHYYIDCEWYNWPQIGQYQAYVAGLVKSKIPETHCIAGVNIGGNVPVFVWKQEYLAQIQTYVWKDGVQNRAVDPNWVLVWASSSTNWNDTQAHGQEMANWVNTIADVLNIDITPIWLGPVVVQPLYLNQWSAGSFSVNFTFAQYTDALNLNNLGNNFVPEMKTVFLDATGDYGNVIGGSAYQNLLDLYLNGDINIVFSGYRYQANFANTIFRGEGNDQCMNAFHLTSKIGSFLNATTLNSDQVKDQYARQIIGDTFGKTYNGYYWSGSMGNNSGFIPLIMYNDGPVQLGIYYDQTSGRFLYGNAWGKLGAPVVDKGVLNRALYWVSDCPISVSDSLADVKIFLLENGEIAIAMMNLSNSDVNLPLTIDLSDLGLDTNKSYTLKWAINGYSSEITNLESVDITLNANADVLIISST